LRLGIFANFNADVQGATAEDIGRRLLETISEPTEADYR